MTPSEPTIPFEPVDALDSEADRPPAPRRRALVTVVIAVLALVAAGVTGAALANGGGTEEVPALAASTGSATPTPDESGPAQKRGRLFDRGRGHLLGGGGALHGTFVVPDGSGGYRTMVVQRGTASKVSDTSITVRSEDGFEQTYAITGTTAVGADRQGVAGIAKGADVAVMGEQKGGSVTALHLADLAAWGGGRPFLGGPGHGPDGDGDHAPVPSPSSSAEGSTYGA
jgi:hypothetical protein